MTRDGNAAIAAKLRDTSSRVLYDINMCWPSGSYAVVPKSLAKKSEVLGDMLEAVGEFGDKDFCASPVAPSELLNQWISCSSRLHSQEIDCESTDTLTSYLKVYSTPCPL
jgi:hypothetical protein